MNEKKNKAQEAIDAIFDEVAEPGTAIIMTVKDNLRTQHGVSETQDSFSSGSLVFRTITDIVPPGTKKVVKKYGGAGGTSDCEAAQCEEGAAVDVD